MSLNSIKVLRFLQKETMSSAVKLSLEQDTLLELERLLGALLRYVLDRDVKAARFLHQVTQRDTSELVGLSNSDRAKR